MSSGENFTTETSIDIISASSNETETDMISSNTDIYFEELAKVLNLYLTPILIVLGTAGNLVSVIVFYMKKLRVQSTSQYLTALAISDILFLWQLVPPWLNAVHLSSVFIKAGFCQMFVYLSYVSSSHSSWLVVAFTVERFVAVLYPLQRSRVCTVRRARAVILALALGSLLINLPVLRFAVPLENDCNIDHELIVHAARFNVVDTIFSFTLPLGIITVFNVWIAISIFRLSRVRGRLIKEENMQIRARTGQGTTRGNLDSRWQGRCDRGSVQRSQQRITTMLLIVSSVFVVLNLPAYVMRITAYASNTISSKYNGRWAALQQICLLFFNTNFGINFFLYCMTGQNFRKALVQTFPCLRRLQRPLKMACCGHCFKTNEQEHLDHHSVSNLDAEVASYTAASENNEEMLRRRLRRGTKYAQLWRFKNMRQQTQLPTTSEMKSVHDPRPPASQHINPTGLVRFTKFSIPNSPLLKRPIPIRYGPYRPQISAAESVPSYRASSSFSAPIHQFSDSISAQNTGHAISPPAQLNSSGIHNRFYKGYPEDLYLYSPGSVRNDSRSPHRMNYLTPIQESWSPPSVERTVPPARMATDRGFIPIHQTTPNARVFIPVPGKIPVSRNSPDLVPNTADK